MMTLHKLSAGDGYTYLTKQVAVGDQQLRAGQQMTDYYAMGERPGIWAGRGIDSLGVFGAVREDQMQALFGEGLHPDADHRVGMDNRLGRPYANFANDSDFKLLYRASVTDFRATYGRGATESERLTIRLEVARRLLLDADPKTTPSVAAVRNFLAVQRRSERHAVAGYDLVFSPCKSISTLWAVAPLDVSEKIEAAHEAAWREVLAWLEKEAALTRVGDKSELQVETRGLVVTAFDHRTSRTGDPDLHTHMVISNKVEGLGGKWGALDARVLHSLTVTASAMYNARVENYVRDALGVAFYDVSRLDDSKRSVREIDGIPPALNETFSKRRTEIDRRLVELIREYREKYDEDPSRAAQVDLAQQANLETREAKGAHHSLAELRGQWRDTAREVLGGKHNVEQMVAGLPVIESLLDDRTPEQVARRVVDVVSRDRSTWNRWNVRAEAERQLRAQPTEFRDDMVDAVETLALGASMRLTVDGTETIPEDHKRSNGESMYRVHGADRYTTEAVLDAEQRLVDAAREQCQVRAVVRENMLDGLDQGQRDLVRRFATTGTRVAVGVGPAGTGKTTAMRALVKVWEANSRKIIGLAPSASAAQTLGEEIGVPADTIARLLTRNRFGHLRTDELRLGDMLLVDEAGIAGTRDLDDLRKLAAERGAVLRLVGDPDQLSSVAAGGALHLLATEVGAAHLTEVHRFYGTAEAEATLLLRAGDPKALEFYSRARRIHEGTAVDSNAEAYMGWHEDYYHGKASVIMAKRNDTVLELNETIQQTRISAGEVTDVGIELRDGQLAGVGDQILTRRNDSTILTGSRNDRVRNGELWVVLGQDRFGSVRARRVKGHAVATFPAAYVRQHIDLGYASTVARAQGITADTARVVVEPGMTRQEFYMAMTRGRESNSAYVPVEDHLDADIERAPDARTDAEWVLRGVLARDGREKSATETMREELVLADRLDTVVRQDLGLNPMAQAHQAASVSAVRALHH